MPASILVVDDDPAVRSGVTALLEQAGYGTRSAATGAQVLALLAQPTQLVVLSCSRTSTA